MSYKSRKSVLNFMFFGELILHEVLKTFLSAKKPCQLKVAFNRKMLKFYERGPEKINPCLSKGNFVNLRLRNLLFKFFSYMKKLKGYKIYKTI